MFIIWRESLKIKLLNFKLENSRRIDKMQVDEQAGVSIEQDNAEEAKMEQESEQIIIS